MEGKFAPVLLAGHSSSSETHRHPIYKRLGGRGREGGGGRGEGGREGGREGGEREGGRGEGEREERREERRERGVVGLKE